MQSLSKNVFKWLAIGLIIAAFLVIDFFTPFFGGFHNEWLMMILVGLCIGQINLIATWAALAPGNIVVRLPWSLLLSLLMWYSLVLGIQVEDQTFSLGNAVLLGGFLLAGVLIAQIPLWMAGKLFRWRLIGWGKSEADGKAGRNQFSLQQMLLGMFILSIALAPLQMVLPPGEIQDMDIEGTVFILFLAVTLCNLLVTVPCIWGAFRRAALIIPVALGWLVYAAALTGIEITGLILVLGIPGYYIEIIFQFYLLNLSQCATVFGTLLILRFLGFQLVRTDKKKKLE